jgi:hypothetical protein
VNSIGFRDDLWIDWNGSVIGQSAKVRERIRRPSYGRLDVEVTVDDPKAYTKPWTVRHVQEIMPEGEIIEFICEENQRFTEVSK